MNFGNRKQILAIRNKFWQSEINFWQSEINFGNQKFLLAIRNSFYIKELCIRYTNNILIYQHADIPLYQYPNIHIQVGYKELCIHMASEHGGLEEVIFFFKYF